VGSITANFQSESPLHPAARAFLADAFDRGWADPAKSHGDSRQAAILLNETKEIFSSHLGVRADQLHFLADPASGFHLGISGLLTPTSTLFYSPVDRSEVHAVANQTNSLKLDVNLQGGVAYPAGTSEDVLAWQAANGETGIIAAHPDHFSGRIFVDATASGAQTPLPAKWNTALWNSRAWQGPTGLGLIAVSDRSQWKNPLPHLDQQISSPEFSLPLAMASALALEAHLQDYKSAEAKLRRINSMIRAFLADEIADVDIAGTPETTLPHLLSFSLLYIDAQQLVDQLDRRGFSIDSGSACSSANLEPSHVLAAMGLLTHGNVRLTLHNEITVEIAQEFLKILKELVSEIRS
jgi:cysteine desulfurase